MLVSTISNNIIIANFLLLPLVYFVKIATIATNHIESINVVRR